MLVEVYFNFRRKVFSIRAAEGPWRGTVIGHSPRVTVWGARFHVSAAGRERVRREKCKNVHAWVRGEVDVTASGSDSLDAVHDEHWAKMAFAHGMDLTYNPYRDEGFVPRYPHLASFLHKNTGLVAADPVVIKRAALVDLQVDELSYGKVPRVTCMGAVPA